MATHDYVIDNSTGANVRADINNVLLAISSNNSGSSAPSTNYASQFFANTNTSIMQLRNTANNAHINLFSLAGSPAFPLDGTINSINIGKGANSVAGNTVLGESALDASVSGGNNIALGKSCCTALTSGASNVGVGMNSLLALTTGSDNVSVGSAALETITTQSANTAVGKRALRANEAANNTAVGYFALDANTTGTQNVAVGSLALDANTTANNNVAVGHNSLSANTTGANNIAMGSGALMVSTTASSNTGLGHQALTANTTGTLNVGVGATSLFNNTTGQRNTAIGENSGANITTGDNNVCIGRDSATTSATVDDQIILGNAGNNDLRCNDQSIGALSDSRDKTDVVDLPVGLSFIDSIRPVKFKWASRDGNGNDGKTRAGFLAQELQTASTDATYLNLVMDDNPDKLVAKYANLIPVMVKAIKELSTKVTALEAG